jgi:hypothetical protein
LREAEEGGVGGREQGEVRRPVAEDVGEAGVGERLVQQVEIGAVCLEAGAGAGEQVADGRAGPEGGVVDMLPPSVDGDVGYIPTIHSQASVIFDVFAMRSRGSAGWLPKNLRSSTLMRDIFPHRTHHATVQPPQVSADAGPLLQAVKAVLRPVARLLIARASGCPSSSPR